MNKMQFLKFVLFFFKQKRHFVIDFFFLLSGLTLTIIPPKYKNLIIIVIVYTIHCDPLTDFLDIISTTTLGSDEYITPLRATFHDRSCLSGQVSNVKVSRLLLSNLELNYKSFFLLLLFEFSYCGQNGTSTRSSKSNGNEN
jgi:hypothetical protein